MRLYSYWRSGTSYRVRLALAFKGVDIEIVPVNLLQREHRAPEFLQINPQGLVPSLELDDGTIISQSPAIIEYIDEAM
ncbi:MAG: glutathione S-transferase N-terminal domain-containing protein, partial [Pseudomonadota bacterium]